jgi:hypothetical protein
MKLEIKPIHGWGWFDEKGAAMEVPPPFELDAEVTQAGDPFTSVLGQFPKSAHPLSGLWLIVSRIRKPFETGFDGNCNLFAFRSKPVVPKISEALSDKPYLTGSVYIEAILD